MAFLGTTPTTGYTSFVIYNFRFLWRILIFTKHTIPAHIAACHAAIAFWIVNLRIPYIAHSYDHSGLIYLLFFRNITKSAPQSTALFRKKEQISLRGSRKPAKTAFMQETSYSGIYIPSYVCYRERYVFFRIFFGNSYQAHRALEGASSANYVYRDLDEKSAPALPYEIQPMIWCDRYWRHVIHFFRSCNVNRLRDLWSQWGLQGLRMVQTELPAMQWHRFGTLKALRIPGPLWLLMMGLLFW